MRWSSVKARRVREFLAFGLLRSTALVVMMALGGIILFILINGVSALSWTFLTDVPREAMTEGGIFPAIIGTLLLTSGALLVALPLGTASAVYLSEFAKEGKTLTIIRIGIQNLAGVPSVIFGLFGLALFCIFLKMGVSLLAGSLTLGFLILPTVIGAAEEALRQVPATFREASLALGATTWQTIRKVVLPAALPGILTGSILGLGRAAGETAPIMFTAATFYTLRTPSSPFDQVMALPYHIHVLANEVCARDDDLDDLNRRLLEDMINCMIEERCLVRPGVEIILAARHYERIGDQATNVAEAVVFIVKGTIIRHQGEISGP